MARRQSHSLDYNSSSTLQTPPRQLKDNSRREKKRSSLPKTQISPWSKSHRKNEFALSGAISPGEYHLTPLKDGTVNSFSILADIEETTSTFSFDLKHGSASASRKYRNRAWKHKRSNLAGRTSPEKERGHDKHLQRSSKQIRGGDLLDEDTIPTEPSLHTGLAKQLRSDRKATAKTVRHHWMPQFRPHADANISAADHTDKPVKKKKFRLSQSPEQCPTQEEHATPAVQMPDFKRKESRFFPLPTFLAASETTFLRASSQDPNRSSSTGTPTTEEEQLTPESLATARQVAASAIRQALTARTKSISHPLTVPLTLKTCRQPLLPQVYAPPPVCPSLSPTPALQSRPSTSQPAPFSITPPITARPALTTSSPLLSTSSALTSTASSTFAPNADPAYWSRNPQRLFPRPPLPSPDPSIARKWPVPADHERPSFPVSAFNIPQANAPLRFARKIRPTTNLAAGSTPVPAKPSCTPSATMNPTAQKHVEHFLKLGHANPCWCTAHPQPTSSLKPLDTPPSDKSHSRGKLNLLTDLELSTSDLDSILLTPPTPGFAADIEDLGALSDTIEEEWTVVTPEVICTDTALVHLNGNDGLEIAFEGLPLKHLKLATLPKQPRKCPSTCPSPSTKSAVSSPSPTSPDSETWTPVSVSPTEYDANASHVSAASSPLEWPTLRGRVGRARHTCMDGGSECDGEVCDGCGDGDSEYWFL